MDRFVATSNRINELLQSVHSLQVDINSLQQEAQVSIARRRLRLLATCTTIKHLNRS